ncbi:alcohol dehydrogenase catalytic domain-containing protein [Oxyplasma meridianum]|uniref:Alcohol dehydrogenase catalytic domain-containing protein n=1 Tax=Oxyplasma meridianum TaxID=3073602 RepID=A0AAX4NFA5_9ARCH
METAVLKKINTDLDIEDASIPVPGPHEVIIKQDMTGICYRDILTREGFFPRVKLPIVPGHEIAGHVNETGSEVKGFKKGDYVASLIYQPCGKCEFCLSGRENLCPYKKTYGETLDGAYSQYVKVSENSLVKVPQSVPAESAVIAACVTGMVYHAIKVVGEIKQGDKILITGAGGGVGTNAISVAKALGAEVIAETSSKWKEEDLRKIGADHVVEMSDHFAKDIKAITGDGVHMVLETVGLETFNQSLRSLRTAGKIIVIGNLRPEPVALPLGNIILKGNSIQGSISSTRDDVKKVLDLTAEGKIGHISNKHVNLKEINSAYRLIKDREVLGRVLVDFHDNR